MTETNAPDVWWSPTEGVLAGENAREYVWPDELPADAVRLVPATLNSELKVGAVLDAGQAREPATIYRRGLKQRIEKTRYRYWGKGGEINVPELTDQILGFLHEQGVEVADDDWAPRSPARDTVQTPNAAALAYARSGVDKWLADADPYCILPTRTEHIPALLARLDELEGTV